jgi:hypothetical protein
MKKALKIMVSLISLLFLSMGVRWAVAPEGMAKELGMPLLEGMGLSTQIGDLGSFFLTCGLLGLIGVFKENRDFLYAAAMLLGGTAVFRLLAWGVYDASLAVPQIAVEVVSAGLLVALAAQFKSPANG